MNRRDFFKTLAVAAGAGIAAKAGVSLRPPMPEGWRGLLYSGSIVRLDTFGISSGAVRARCEELLSQGANRPQAFMVAVMEQAEAQRVGE